MFELTGKTAIVTASSAGMGKGIVVALARQGAQGVVSSRTVDKVRETTEEIRSLGGKAIGIPADARVKHDVENLVRKTVEEFGRVDVLVNVAGVGFRRVALEMTEEELLDHLLARRRRTAPRRGFRQPNARQTSAARFESASITTCRARA